MPKDQHVLIVKLNARDQGEKAKLKKQIGKMIEGELTPAIESFLTSFLLYHPKNLTGKTTLESFWKNNAGIITKALIDNIDKASIDSKKSGVTVEDIRGTVKKKQVAIQASALPDTYKALSDKKFSEAGIMRKIAGFDENKESQILNRAAKALKDEARS